MKSKRFLNIAVLILLSAFGVIITLKSKAVADAVIASIGVCVYRIVPSLFAMTVISSAISKSGAVTYLLRKAPINADIFTAFIFGNIGGYPVGAKLLSEMTDRKSITPSQAASAMVFCYGSGPAFAAGVAGTAIFNDVRFGLAALLASFMANLTLYIIYTVRTRYEAKTEAFQKYEGFSTKLMTDSVSSAAGTMIGICSMIVFFSAVKAAAEEIIPALKGQKIISSILEISNISAFSECKGVSLVVISLLLAFGGICVHLQILAVIGGKFSVKQFYLSRLVQLPLCGIYAYILQAIMERLGIAAEASTKIRLSQSPSLIPVICVAAMVAITLFERAKTLNRQSF